MCFQGPRVLNTEFKAFKPCLYTLFFKSDKPSVRHTSHQWCISCFNDLNCVLQRQYRDVNSGHGQQTAYKTEKIRREKYRDMEQTLMLHNKVQSTSYTAKRLMLNILTVKPIKLQSRLKLLQRVNST